ncbi:uncharacterized protein LOC105182884 [Harpegnathos saltator]|nr:uncharacterized protein LOC105182884 [Harpegnathos saltator]
MASQRYMPLAAILTTICLDISSVAVNVVAATVVWDPKTSRYDGSYNLDKGPVFYEAYYPDVRDAYQEKRYFDRNTVLETSFQVPSDRFAYSAESLNRPASNDESSFIVVDDNAESLQPEDKQRGTIGRGRNVVQNFHDRPAMFPKDDDESSLKTNIGEISKLVRRAISRDLENWNALEKYLDRASNQGQQTPITQSEMRSKESRENNEFDSSQKPSLGLLRQLEARNVKLQPTYFEEVRNDASGSALNVGDARAADAPIAITSNSDLPLENIFQPRPQIIKYTFLKKTKTRHDGPSKDTIDNTTPRNYGDNIIREEIANDSHDGRLAKGNVKVTSIQVSELPRHKTRHHHGELPKRDYTARHHRTASVASPIVR